MAVTERVLGRPRPELLLWLLLGLVFVGLLLQIGPSSFIEGDGDWYLRDAAAYANGEIARSRYSPGFALFLAPLMAVVGGDVVVAGAVAVAVNAILTVAGVVLCSRFLRPHLGPSMAAGMAALLAVCQGVTVYAGHVRPEPLALVLAVAGMLALRNERSTAAVVLGAVLVLLRVALAPFVLVVWLVWLRRSPRVALAGVLLVLVAASASLATQPLIDDSYAEIGGGIYQVEGGASGRLLGVVRIAVGNVDSFGRYALPRLAWPFQALASPLGPVLAGATLAVIAVGLVVLLRRTAIPAQVRRRRRALRDASPGDAVLVAATVGAAAYLGLLMLWPIRDLAAVRMVIPVAFVPLAGLGAGLTCLARRRGPRPARLVAAAVLPALLLVNGVASAVVVGKRQSTKGADDFVIAHELVRPLLPLGPVISTQPAATELLLGRAAFDYPLDGGELEELARRLRACTFVIDGEVRSAWLQRHRGAVLAEQGDVEVVSVASPWCA